MSGTVIVILSLFACTNAFIIPEELPTLLSVIYSNIPPIKLGFDTRLGFGFRIGPHADFQTVIEIGPQENTRPIGMGNETLSKRQSLSRNQIKLLTAKKKPAAETTEEENVKENETIEPSLANFLLGRKEKKQLKPHFGEIEFKKVPGIDDMKKITKTKSAKLKADKSPTKIVIFS